jgi:hypothetical protein
MLSQLISLTILSMPQMYDASTDWAMKAAADLHVVSPKQPRSVLSTTISKMQVRNSTSNAEQIIVQANPPILSDQVVALWKEANTAKLNAYRLVMRGRAREASSRLNSQRAQLYPIITSAFIDCELLAGQYEQAYQDQAEDLKSQRVSDYPYECSDRYLRLSIDIDGLGKKYDGQFEYAKHEVLADWYLGKPFALSSKSNAQQQLMATSTLALALQDGAFQQPFLELAVRSAPKEPLLAEYAVYICTKQTRFSGVRTISQLELSQATDSETRSFFQKCLNDCSGRDDLPGSSIIVPTMPTGNPPATP